MECLHFELFLETLDCPENVVEAITLELDEIKKAKNLENHKYSSEMEDVFRNYYAYKTETLNGSHGKTAAFWMMYVDMLHLYRDFTRSIRTGNLDL